MELVQFGNDFRVAVAKALAQTLGSITFRWISGNVTFGKYIKSIS